MPNQLHDSASEAKNVIRTHRTGYDLLLHPGLNKGTAFTEEERDVFGLHGLLPPHIGTLENQRERRKKALDNEPTAFGKYSLMRDLQDNDEVLFYSLIAHHIEELLPVVYTPAVGEGCQRFSEIWRKPRGLFISYPDRHLMDKMLANPRYNEIRCIVVSDGERILGLGDQGAGGMGIPIGKMALYTALGGIPPHHCLPILLDAGTDNQALLDNPIYIGWQHHRVRGPEYDEFIEMFVAAVMRRWPNILLQWEDFAGENALKILAKYRDRLCTFNDDVQGTAAVTTGTLLAAVQATGVPLKDQRIAMFGSGSAGVGIINLLIAALKDDGLSEAEARQRIYAFNRHGLMVEGDPALRASQMPLARKKEDVEGWKVDTAGPISLFDTVRNAKITVLVGTSAQAGAFTEETVRELARNAERPVILPLSNPTSKSEAAPADLLKWTDGKALIGTGSPFAPVEIDGRTVRISQTNNSYIFPGLALGILVSKARRVTDGMIMAAAKKLASLSPAVQDANAPLLPPIGDSRKVGLAVAEAVGMAAIAEGVSDMKPGELGDELRKYVWEPVYRRYELVKGDC
ncbi:NAD-dependent malic enzyme [Occallatibacter riparius]|uniref:NAD-dependent malic enzyme n=1 Tax=Occallatibacter riparius TaxID=1002689 RepID=A0A9J7BVF9_9BACT|nr:NAD-dependent malic enzyme [Occallatibacter riparius]UWZ86671.1 NAD-dependent malic enzyme [Occallatibacter riparius]